MRAAEIDEEFPVVDIDSPALEAARMLAEHSLPGIVVLTADGQLYAVLPASQVVRFIVPSYVQEDPLLARRARGVGGRPSCGRVGRQDDSRAAAATAAKTAYRQRR